jgi:hypothetical protein
MSFMHTMKDKTRLGNTGNVLHAYDERQITAEIQEMSFMSIMKDKTRLGNTGNVLHEYDESQNTARKYRKCPS